ncbi:pyridoxal phosphate-dependent decarboxylase family protein [Halomonas binhaiensis]|uniref:Aspartate aminotransferase family protein n=1 Tax=Halomonas binhaiensis TaxID=2562282 RepID=A0A5C1NIM1_9GAMM|nr:aspartate aminotransferase family protein [Halomonas binhaiensis]QEM82710.1 aspartate aminotransferase family protein [Halomonas binhaiensis]
MTAWIAPDRQHASPEHDVSLDDTQLFTLRHRDAYRAQAQRCIDLVHQHLDDVERPFSGVTPEELRPLFRGLDLDAPLGQLEPALAELKRLYLNDAVYFHHPRYVAHLNCPVVLPGVIAETIISSINTSLDTWDQSAGGTLIEQALIDWTAQRLGLGEDADGVFTSGGTQSNLMAMLIARDRFCVAHPEGGDIQQQGLPGFSSRLRILASGVSHFSLKKAAALLGLGHQAVMPVACDDQFRMDPPALRECLEECQRDGLLPIAVVATAGTTDFGSIDPIDDIAALCREYGIWLHVDAAYGGGLVTSQQHRHRLQGIDQADSVTIDYHKSFFQPVSCSAFLVRQRRDLGYVTYHADYLNPRAQAEAGTPDQVNKSLQTTKRFDALKLWLTLRIMGADAIGGMLDQVIELTGEGYELLREQSDIETLVAPSLSTLVFRFRPQHMTADTELDALQDNIRARLSRSGEALVAATRVNGQRYLKFTLLNPDTHADDLRAVINAIREHGYACLQVPHAPRSATRASATTTDTAMASLG